MKYEEFESGETKRMMNDYTSKIESIIGDHATSTVYTHETFQDALEGSRLSMRDSQKVINSTMVLLG